jgi:hypothetical protein
VSGELVAGGGELALDDAQDVAGDTYLVLHGPGGLVTYRSVEEVADGGDQLGRGRTVVEVAHRGQPTACRHRSTSHSFSEMRRPMAASSTDGSDPLRCRLAWEAQMIPQCSVPMTIHQVSASRSTGPPDSAS